MQSLPKATKMLEKLIKINYDSIDYHMVKVKAIKEVRIKLSKPVVAWAIEGWLRVQSPIKGNVEVLKKILYREKEQTSFNIYEIKALIRGIELRIEHCAQEREAGAKEFKLETFLTMREVVLELKMLLLTQ
jgi:hypothetical protein